MELIEFPEQTIIIAKDQPEYLPLPAHIDAQHIVTCCWRLSWKERLRILFTGLIWHQIMTFGTSLQPQMLHVKKPELTKQEQS